MSARNNCNHKNKKIILRPDFSSTGVWCECGIGFGDPIKHFPNIPEGIFELVQLWNDYWDDNCFMDSLGKKVDSQDRINKMGLELSKIISKYHQCEFYKENSKICGR